jgi:hypothetical protein
VRVLQMLRDAVPRKRRGKWQGQRSGYWVTVTRRATRRLLCGSSSPVVNQPPQSPDLAPTHLCLCPSSEKGAHFVTVEAIKSNATAELRKIKKNAFNQCCQQQDRLSKCVGVYLHAKSDFICNIYQ